MRRVARLGKRKKKPVDPDVWARACRALDRALDYCEGSDGISTQAAALIYRQREKWAKLYNEATGYHV